MNFARTIKMLILSATFMGGAVLTPMLTTPLRAQGDVTDVIVSAGPGGDPHVKVFSSGAYDAGFTGGVYVAASDVSYADGNEEEDTTRAEIEIVADQGSTAEDTDASAASSNQPEYKYISVRR